MFVEASKDMGKAALNAILHAQDNSDIGAEGRATAATTEFELTASELVTQVLKCYDDLGNVLITLNSLPSHEHILDCIFWPNPELFSSTSRDVSLLGDKS